MQAGTIGWDIGGAHVKAALLSSAGEIVDIALYPCPLWQGMAMLEQAVAGVFAQFPRAGYRHAVTMTGELVDLFASRGEGVARIIQTMRALLGDAELLIYAGRRGFLSPDQVTERDYPDIASMNWLASASLVARNVEAGLFIDIGSTTSDILFCSGGQVRAQGVTDYERLVTGELVYTGIVRTPVMAVARQAVFNGQAMGLMAEFFATMADVYRVSGELNEAHDLSPAADGGDKTPVASALRLSRMTGFDFRPRDWPLWLAFARELKAMQGQTLLNACRRQLDRVGGLSRGCVVGAGVGRFLVSEIAGSLGYPYCDFNALFHRSPDLNGLDSGDCAPAVAVARLAFRFC